MAKKKTSKPSTNGAKKATNGKAGKNGNSNVAVTEKPKFSWTSAIVVAFLAFGVGLLAKPALRYLGANRDLTTGRKLSSTGAAGSFPSLSCNHDSDELQDYLADAAVPGQHTLCFKSDWHLTHFKDSRAAAQLVVAEDFSKDFGSSWKKLKAYLIPSLNLENRRFPNQAWVLFDKHGERIVGDDDVNVDEQKVLNMIQASGIVMLYEGGIFIWPGIREGYSREIELDYVPTQGHVLEKKTATLVTLSLKPLVFSVTGFLSESECDYIQDTAEPNMKYSGVTLMDKDKGRPASDFRTSQTAFLGPQFKGLEPIDLRTSSLVRIPRSHQEHVQVLRYGETEKYNAHHDFFAPHLYKNDPSTLKLIENGKKNRLATVFWYLTTVPQGGETIFPRAGGAGPPKSMADCTVGLKVKPEKGKVIIFYSMTAEGATDEYSLHGACPVEEGIKWAANKWVWNKPTGFYAGRS